MRFRSMKGLRLLSMRPVLASSRLLRLACGALMLALVLTAAGVISARAQENADEASPESGMNGPAAIPPMSADQVDAPAPFMRVPMRQPVAGTMMVSPPYGLAPLRVGFFVMAEDPENVGFLTYQWNFGDGTVSALPPEMYIFHTYHLPGNYVCTLILKTTDGRQKTLFSGVLVR
jgi:PKD domain